MYKVLIVDDEFLARKLMQEYVRTIPDLTLCGTCQNALEAFKIIKTDPVDIILLDIHMPDLNGIDFARLCSDTPAIIFTTAYSEYALESYNVAAVDYLLKPISQGRFAAAIAKAKAKIDSLRLVAKDKVSPTTDTAAQPQPTTDAAQEGQNPNFLVVKADRHLYKINYKDLLYIEGQHEYVSFHTTGKRITALYSLKSLEESLPDNMFVRVHKSYIVSLAHIQEVDQQNITVNDVKIPIGGSYKENLLQKLTALKDA